MRGARYFFRNFTAMAVQEHLRSQVERADGRAELTPNEARLVRYVAGDSGRLREVADKTLEQEERARRIELPS